MADDPLADRAAFAQRFRNTTNLDQRRRFAQDIASAAARDEERRAQEFEDFQLNNPEAMRAVTGRMAEQRLQREGAGRSNLAERKFVFEQEKASRSESIAQRKLELDMKRESRMLADAERELDDAFRIEEDTDKFMQAEKGLRERGVLPGTQAYRDALGQLVAEHPYVDPQYRNPVLQGAGVTDPDDLQRQLAELRESAGPNARITINKDGVPTISEGGSKTSQAQAKIDLPRLDKLKAKVAEERAKGKRANAELIGYLDGEIAEIDQQRVAAAGKPTQQVAQAPQSNFTNPQDFKKAFESAASGTILLYNGQKWRKP